MLTIRDIPEPLNAEFKDAITNGYKERNKAWKNQPSPDREEIYRQAFQDGIRASLRILPVLLKAQLPDGHLPKGDLTIHRDGSVTVDATDSGFDVHHPEAAPTCRHGIPKSIDCTRCKADDDEKKYIESLQPDARNEPLPKYPKWRLKSAIICDDGSTYAEGTVFLVQEDTKSYAKLVEITGEERVILIIKGAPSGREVMDKMEPLPLV